MIEIYDHYADKIFRHLYFRLHDREQALDLMQETFMKTFVYMQNKGPLQNVQAFLYKVANNLIFDQYKKKKTHSLEQLQEEGFTPSIDDTSQLKNKIDADKILEIVGGIPPQYRTVIVMRYVDELSIEEIAEVLGETKNTISVKINRAIHHVRKLLKNYE